jgi:nucleoside-diphosphate-sugar epimerase
MADVLVTGATGLLGGAVVRLLADRHRVTAMSRRPDGEPGVHWVTHDLAQSSLPRDLPSHVDAVVHLAQSRQFRDFPGGAPDVFAVNVAGTAQLLQWALAAGATTFVLASTGGVYDAGPHPHREDEATTLPGAPSFYASSKLAAELLARSYGSQMTVCVLRPFFIYGPGQDRGMLLPRLAHSLRTGAVISIDGADGMRFNPVHVSDAAQAVGAALDLQESGVINVAGPEILSLREAVNLLAAHAGVKPNLHIRGDPAPTDFIGDTARMEALLVPPRTALRDVLEDVSA